jgi:uncharacterized protein (DUF58 family)
LARLPGIRVTAAGWAMLLLVVVGWGLGGPLGWTELRYLGAGATLVVVVGLLAVLVPRRATAEITARPARTSVGATTTIELSVRAHLLPVASPVVRIEGDLLGDPVDAQAAQVLRLRTLWPGRTRVESFEHVAGRRGIFSLGPVRHEQSDPLGQFRRIRSWGAASTLWVRPRVLVPGPFSHGGVFDLEGLPSEQISLSDLAFHALREYAPGDDLRRVHWRSSAKAGTLLVRQYHESRSRNAAVVVDDGAASYADAEELEIAISVAASLAIRALTDGFDVDVACGERVSTPVGREALLDETCAWGLAAAQEVPVDVLARATHLARTGTAIGIGVVVSGSTCDLERLLEAASAFGAEAHRIAVRVDPSGRGGVRDVHGVRVLEIGRLDQLPELAAWAAG